MAAEQTIFFLGATGFLGSQLLVSLGRAGYKFPIVALVRQLSDEKKEKIRSMYSNIEFVEGTLTDSEVMIEQASKASYVINCASSDHPASIQYILTGLEKNSAANPGKPPVYIHTSGMCILSDNARGEPVDEASITHYVDSAFSVDKVSPENPHVNCDALIVAAGSRKENPVRTIIWYPAWVYGLGEGYRKSSGGVRLFLEANKIIGRAGTWGPGANSFVFVHIKDCVAGMMKIFEASLQGKTDEGAKGYYFIASEHPPVSWHEYSSKIGDMLHSRGMYSESGSKPYPAAVTDLFGDFGWRLLGCNQRVTSDRLKKMGWEATESKRLSLLDSLPEEIDVAFVDLQPKGSILRPEDE